MRGARDPVEIAVFVDRPLYAALRGGPVVAEDQDEEGVFELADPREPLDKPADLGVGVLGEAGVQFHKQACGPLCVGVKHLPERHTVDPRRKLGVLRDDAELFLARQRQFPLHVPTMVEATAILVDPLRAHMKWSVRRAEREVAEEPVVGHHRPHGFDPRERLVDDVLGEVYPSSGVRGGSTGVVPSYSVGCQ